MFDMGLSQNEMDCRDCAQLCMIFFMSNTLIICKSIAVGTVKKYTLAVKYYPLDNSN